MLDDPSKKVQAVRSWGWIISLLGIFNASVVRIDSYENVSSDWQMVEIMMPICMASSCVLMVFMNRSAKKLYGMSKIIRFLHQHVLLYVSCSDLRF